MKRQQSIILVFASMLFLSSYAWACYVAGSCTCAVVGSCYSQQILPDCQVPTCIIADTSATVWNVCAGAGPYQSREATGVATCCPAACRLYDNCAHQYILLQGGSCCFSVQRYEGVGSGCN